MNDRPPIQQHMYAELADTSLFRQATEFGLDYLQQAFERHVFPTEAALSNLEFFEEDMPEAPSQAQEVLSHLHQYGSPGAVTQIGGRYFGFVNGSVTPAGLAAKQLALFWDQNSAMQVLSPISSTLERVVQRWLIDLFGLPAHTVAGFVSGTSMANFCGLAAARYRILKDQGWDVTEQGLMGAPPIRVVTGKQAHSTVLKAISMVGLGKGNIEWVEVDEEGRIIPEAIPRLDHRTILVLQAGNVNSGSFDNFEAICQQARAQGAWIHVDGAFGLWAAATESLAYLTQGYQYAHSWAVDGHKTLNTPYDSGVILCCDSEALVSSLHMTGSYLVIGADRDGMYYTPEMSRRARVIELWATLKYLGKEGIDQMVVGFNDRAKQFANLLRDTPGFTVLNEIVFNQVLVQCETDALTEQVIKQIQAQRECWVGGSSWQGRKVIRISICSWATTEADVERSHRSFVKALAQVRTAQL